MLVRLWGVRPRRHNNNKQQQPLQLQPRQFFGCRRHCGLFATCVILALLLLLQQYYYSFVRYYDTSRKNLHATQLCCRRYKSGVRCKTSPYSSATCGSFCRQKRLPPCGVAPCTLLLLRGASVGPGLLVPPARSKSKATRTDVPLNIPPTPILLALQA